MTSRWHQKKEKQRLEAEARAERAIPDETFVKDQTSSAAMGGGEDELFERKLTKEEKKAAAKAAREAKKKAKAAAKKKSKGGDGDDEEDDANKEENAAEQVAKIISDVKISTEESKAASERNEAAEQLATEGTICTYATSKKGVDGRSRDINIQNFTMLHMGNVMLDECEIVLNHGNRYGLIGRNGCGKSTLMRVLGARAVPIPAGIDIFHLKEEIEPSDTITAIEAVMNVDEERARLEKEADQLNHALTVITDGVESSNNPSQDNPEQDMTLEEQQEQIMDMLNDIYDRLDALDADTAETRARGILRGLGFTHEMQAKLTKDFSGGWRMRVSLARALFIQPTLLLLDEPTNHLDMEAVIWLEDYLSKWDRILFLVSHSQDFLNNVCSHMIHFTNRRKLEYYDGNYDQFIKTKGEKEENQMKQYKWEQDQIKSMKEYIARFGHGTAKNAKQAQSKEKVLEKMIRNGLTEMPEVEKPMNFKFPDPGHLPPPVLSFRDVSFAYPGCAPLYDEVNFGVDLDSRVALVGPNGAGKTTLVKLMSGELQPTLGDIRPHGHLKMGRFTQHFVDVLDLTKTPLDFFSELYPEDSFEDLRKYLGRFGVSGKMQVQTMEQLSDGQKSRVVFAKLGRDSPHILLLDEPTNHLDMESIDALAKAIREFEGGLVLVSHDMRLISQVANEIWICDHKTVRPYKGDIGSFKMDMRAQMGIQSGTKTKLRGDASVKTADGGKKKKAVVASVSKAAGLEVVKPKPTKPPAPAPVPAPATSPTSSFGASASYGSKSPASTSRASPVPPPVKEAPADAWGDSDEEDYTPVPAPAPPASDGGRYIPPHLRNR